MADGVEYAKRALREELRGRRRTMTATEREHATSRLTQRLVDLAVDLQVRRVSAYLAQGDEPDTRPFIDWAHRQGIAVLLPVSRSDGLLDWAEYDAGDEDLDVVGMPAPTSPLLHPMAVDEVDLVLVPASCVDRSGVRMGWGRGYFDKMLGSMQRRPPVYAVVFDGELVDEVPREAHDQPVDGVVRPAEITAF